MAIEFYCPGCGKLMRTPDPTAGRKGRCPHCATKVQIPLASINHGANSPAAPSGTSAEPQRSAPQQPAARQPQSQRAGNEPIQFVCGSCHKTLRVPAANAGKKGKCPNCGTVMTIPTQAPVAKLPSQAKWKGGPQPAAAATPIQFTCPGCQKSVRVNASAAGQQGQCPHCRTVVKIPLKTAAQPRPTNSGLTPLDSSRGLAPPGSTPGLTPLDDFGGLTPLGAPDPFGPDPFASAADPLGGLTELSAPGGFASQDPFGGAASYPSAPTNPYASPATTPAYATRSKASRSRGSRSGLPWDNKGKDKAPFIGTIKLVLFSPALAFCLMRRSGGGGNPMLYCIYGNLIGGAFAMLYSLIWNTISTLPALMAQRGVGQAGAGEKSAFFMGVLLGMLCVMIAGLLLLVLFTVIGVYLNAGMFHLGLMVLGGANHNFETTVRVVQYTIGSTAICAVIPAVGAFIQFIANIVILSIGLANAHETSGVKATFAVLIPFLLCIGLFVGGVVLILAMVGAAAANAG